MRIWLCASIKLFWGIYLLLTSVYCLLAFLPYTYFALIKAPPYDWMPWFAHHQAMLYWLGVLAIAAAEWPERSGNRRSRAFALPGVLAVGGLFLAIRPFMPTLQNNWAAYRWSLIALAPLAVPAGMEVVRFWPRAEHEPDREPLFAYSNAVLIAAVVALLYGAGVEVHSYFDKKPVVLNWAGFELTGWSVFTHVLVAILILSLLNLIFLSTQRTRKPRSFRLGLIGLSVFAALWIITARFLNSALSFAGWAAQVYAACLSVCLTLWLGSLALPLLGIGRAGVVERKRSGRKLVVLAAVVVLALLAVALPTLIGGGDWNGVLQHTFALLFWIAFSICVYSLSPRRASYSLATILAVILVAGFAYKGLQATEIFWAKPLGSTDDEVARAFEAYAADDVSFQIAHHVLGNERAEPCGDLCRILREYTNIRDAEAKTELRLVDAMVSSPSLHPNIFILVIDSMRPDYLGAYNPAVDFTPQIDAFARDSIALRNVYTQYAGTTLSEPAIWAGAMLLHAHYMQPFSRVNGLEKLANTDGYQIMVSYDTVLSQILSPNDNLIKLDTDKPLWNRFEACSTLQQTEAALDAGAAESRPVLFYAQPMNVHQFANNNMPRMTSQNWRIRPGFNNRIAYEVHQVDDCLGGFFAYLKARGLYDKSIIVLTSDHGDATGEFGRYSHSTTIYPEIVRVPLIVHLPEKMRKAVLYDDSHLSALTDITPSLYYLLGHRPIRANALFGHPLFVETQEELERYRRDELFLASDERAVYGLLAENGRFLYTTYDSPPQSFLFDLSSDPNAVHNLLSDSLKERYDERIIDELHAVANFYGYTPGVGSLLAAR